MEKMKPYLSVVIPAYNEEKGIAQTLRKVTNFLDEQEMVYEAIVVDDGSTDQTTREVEKFVEKNKNVRLIKNDHYGKGYTVRTGILNSKGKYILFSDADLATPIEELKRLFLWILDHDYDIAIASREGIGSKREGEPLYRHLMGRVFNSLVQLLLLKGINDTQCGFKLFKGDVARELFSKLKLHDDKAQMVLGPRVTAFDTEVLFLARKLGYKIKEVPVTWKYVRTPRVHPVKDSWRMFWEVIRIQTNDLLGKYEN